MAPKANAPNGGRGRPKGARNKVTALLKDAILQAAVEAGGDHGEEGDDRLVAYLAHIARTQPAAFCGLLGKVLPLTLAGDKNSPLVTRVELVAPKSHRDAAVAAALRADG
ncbi:hypothetical protein [Kaistia adipata]|uniref:hypothetical protein n=1 Tax=Kaistia adipata TaxID=166954 RepID=UPI00055AFF25|nr:hypothetical protein [Kaistia adipata]